MKRAVLIIIIIAAATGSILTGCGADKDRSALSSNSNVFAVSELDLSKVSTGEGVAYIPLQLDGSSDEPENVKTVIAALDQFQEKNKVKIISWSIDKQQNAYSTDAIVFGLCVTFESKS